VDVVANHAWTTADVSGNKPFDDPSDYHDCSGCPNGGCNVNDYHDLTQMEHCRLAGLMDFNQTDAGGKNANLLYDWIEGLVGNFSVDGLRVDTLPYVHADFWRKFEVPSFSSSFQWSKNTGLPSACVTSAMVFFFVCVRASHVTRRTRRGFTRSGRWTTATRTSWGRFRRPTATPGP
jgi:hypothetical protein